MSSPHYLMIPTDGAHPPFAVSEPTPSDYEFADVGMLTIVRLHDLHHYNHLARKWAPFLPGKLVTAELSEIPDARPFHVADV